MKFKIVSILLVIFCSLLGCYSDDITGYKQLSNIQLSDSLFVERYSKSYGAIGGGIKKYFLTNYSDYNLMIGQCDEKEFFKIAIEGDQVVVIKHSRRNQKNGVTQIISTKTIELPN
jgi:hypothetical protein